MSVHIFFAWSTGIDNYMYVPANSISTNVSVLYNLWQKLKQYFIKTEQKLVSCSLANVHVWSTHLILFINLIYK